LVSPEFLDAIGGEKIEMWREFFGQGKTLFFGVFWEKWVLDVVFLWSARGGMAG
jgi:hypothetical protein